MKIWFMNMESEFPPLHHLTDSCHGPVCTLGLQHCSICPTQGTGVRSGPEREVGAGAACWAVEEGEGALVDRQKEHWKRGGSLVPWSHLPQDPGGRSQGAAPGAEIQCPGLLTLPSGAPLHRSASRWGPDVAGVHSMARFSVRWLCLLRYHGNNGYPKTCPCPCPNLGINKFTLYGLPVPTALEGHAGDTGH